MYSSLLFINMNNFCYGHIFRIHNFRVKSDFEPNVFKWVIKMIYINLHPFAFLIINVKFFSIFKKNYALLLENMDV